MDVIEKTERNVITEYGRYLLRYELIRQVGMGAARCCYGFRIVQRDRDGRRWSEIAEVRGFTFDLWEAERFYEMIVDEIVMPVSLYEVVDDWQSAFHPRNQKITRGSFQC